jgi:hypothetical protein
MQLSLCELLYWLELVADQALAALWEVERRIGKDEAAFKSVEPCPSPFCCLGFKSFFRSNLIDLSCKDIVDWRLSRHRKRRRVLAQGGVEGVETSVDYLRTARERTCTQQRKRPDSRALGQLLRTLPCTGSRRKEDHRTRELICKL